MNFFEHYEQVFVDGAVAFASKICKSSTNMINLLQGSRLGFILQHGYKAETSEVLGREVHFRQAFHT